MLPDFSEALPCPQAMSIFVTPVLTPPFYPTSKRFTMVSSSDRFIITQFSGYMEIKGCIYYYYYCISPYTWRDSCIFQEDERRWK